MSEDQVPEPPPSTPPPPPPVAAVGKKPPSETEIKNWCVAGHLSGLLGLMFPGIGNVGGPLAVLLMKRDDIPQASRHAKEALNFQISLLIWNLVATAVAVVLCLVLIGFFLLIGVWITYYIMSLLFPVLAALRASEGQEYRYPMTIRFVS